MLHTKAEKLHLIRLKMNMIKLQNVALRSKNQIITLKKKKINMNVHLQYLLLYDEGPVAEFPPRNFLPIN